MTKILVTGATGTVGRQVVADLARAGQDVRAASRSPETHDFPQGVEAVRFDYADEDSIVSALEGVECLFLLSPGGLEDQVARQRRAIDLARAAGVQHIVLMTAMGVPEESPHGQVEVALKGSGVAWTILHPSFFAKNFATYVRDSILEHGAFYYPAGDGRVAYIDARDIGAVAAAVLSDPSPHAEQTYDLTGPESIDHTEAAAALSAATDREIVYVDPGEEAYRSTLREAGTPESVVELFTNLYAVVVKNGWAATTTDTVERVLGREPIDFATFARDHASTWRAEGASS